MALPKIVHKLAKKIASAPFAGMLIRRVAGGRLHLRYRWRHPVDAAYGVDTSGYVVQKHLSRDKGLASKINHYTGVQPSVLRKAFAELPDLRDYTFIDIGCGKGRAAIVASEFSFKRIVGVELSEKLADAARQNAAHIAGQFPARAKIEIVTGNAVEFPIAGTKIVLFLYNPFGEELMRAFIHYIEQHVGKDIDHLFMFYHNPVWGAVPDASKALTRWYADVPSVEPSEANFGPEVESATVIWQSAHNALPSPHSGRERAIVRVNILRTALVE